MEVKETLKGVPGLLRPFKKFLEDENLSENSQIVFYGCPGTCLPFIELIAYAIRSLPVKCIFVPFLEEEKAAALTIIDGMGAQINPGIVKPDPKVVVIMGGLSMPNIPVTAEGTLNTISKYDAKVVGICFMEMLEKEGWTEKINFDMIIDAAIDPVKVYR